ncbi:hypothetical protein CBR_g26041 [Chara braunii]|uniref:Integrase catalytic domain-containing protein n=1 Tax=Chara braunii TaxID=69332 RepID=A0A388L746_CHABU|nr:hypothetical protein CBR_g26041 [Chara braunii]|eukprot:GBG78104.1 hypothetical protein CBR_g26041 [Chara braunii]
MQQIMEIQEREVAMAGNQRQTGEIGRENGDGTGCSVSSSAGSVSEELTERHLPDCKTRLLARWRQEVFELIFAQKLSDLNLQKEVQAREELHAKMKAELRNAETQIRVLKQKEISVNAEVEIQRTRNRTLEASIRKTEAKLREAQRDAEDGQSAAHQIASKVQFLSESFCEKLAAMEKTWKRLDGYGQRLWFARSRLIMVLQLVHSWRRFPGQPQLMIVKKFVSGMEEHVDTQAQGLGVSVMKRSVDSARSSSDPRCSGDTERERESECGDRSRESESSANCGPHKSFVVEQPNPMLPCAVMREMHAFPHGRSRWQGDHQPGRNSEEAVVKELQREIKMLIEDRDMLLRKLQRETTSEDDRILRSARRPIANVALGPKGDRLLFRQLRERQQQQRRARPAEASRAFASEAAASAAMASVVQQSSQASSSGSIGSTIAQTLSQSTGVMASQPIVLTPEEVAIQQAALREAQLQKALGEIKAEKEEMIRRRARMQRRQADISELEAMDLTEMNDDVRTLRTVLLGVVEMQDHQMALLQDIQQSLAQNPEEGMYLVYVSAAGEPVKMPPKIEGVVAKYPDLFEEPKGVVEREVVHAIEIIPGFSIPKVRICRMSPGELDELRRQLKELVEKGWIRPSVSPYESPILFVQKKVGTLRMCIDYRDLNAITVKNREPLPRIDDLLDRVQGCRYFSKIDLKSGCHQIAIRPEDQHKTAFQTKYSLYEFVVMPFGLSNAPGTFQHAMSWIFHDYLDKFVIVYLDDILIFSRTVEEHVGHLDKVLSLLRQPKFKINGEKCEFGRTRILYLGHEIFAEGLKPDDAKVASIRDWPRPQSVTEMRSFLGMTGYYHNFRKNYSIVAAPLTDLTRLDTPWEWTDRPDFLGALITEFGLADDVTRSLVDAYHEDPFMAEIIRKLEAKDKTISAEFELVNGLLFLEKAGNKRLCVPNRESLRSLFLGECHDAIGHFGYKKTAANLLQQFWWPTMMRDAKLYVEACQVYLRDKPRTQAPLGLLKPVPIPERPGESLSMDFMDTLVTSKSGMRHIFVIVDRFSKYARLVEMPETAKTKYVIKMFKENWVRDFGLPKSIVSDRDVRFTSELWKAAAAEQGTQLQMTSGKHPEANGQAEQLNHAVQHLLRHYIKPN